MYPQKLLHVVCVDGELRQLTWEYYFPPASYVLSPCSHLAALLGKVPTLNVPEKVIESPPFWEKQP